MKKLYFPLLAAGLLTCTTASAYAAPVTPQGVVAVADADDPYPDQKPYGPDLTMTFVLTGENSSVVEGKIIAPESMMSDWYTGVPERPIPGKIDRLYVVRKCDALNEVDVPVAEWTDVDPGQEFTFTDRNIEIGRTYSYNSYAVVNGNSSESWYGSMGVYTGIRPNALREMKAIGTEGHGPVTVSFVIPGEINEALPEGVTYTPERVYVTRSYRDLDYNTTEQGEVWSMENPAVDTEISFVDTNNGLEMEPGTYNYYGYVVWKWGESYDAGCTVGLYEDAPGAPASVWATTTEEGVVISWTPPVQGKNGGWLNPEGIRYDVYRYADYSKGKLVAADVEGLSALDDLEDIDSQTMMQYQVIAKNNIGTGDNWGGICEGVIVGPAASLPFEENFPASGWSVKTQHLWARQTYVGQGYWYTSTSGSYTDQDGAYKEIKPSMEGHGLVMTGYASYYPSGISTYMSGDIDFSEYEHGTLIFSYYTHPLGSVDLAAEIVRYDDFTPVQADIMPLDEGDAYETVWSGNCAGEEGWQEVSVDFSGFKDSDTVMIRFRAVQDEPESGVYVPACIQYVKLEGRTGDVGVETVSADIASIEHYNLQGVRIAAPLNGEVSIRRTVLSDGTVRTAKVFVK